MFKGLLLLGIISLVGCQPEAERPNPFKFYKKPVSSFQSLVNQSNFPAQPATSGALRLVNHEYPIEISLFKDGKFHYILETLGDGQGTWKYSEGMIRLHAERKLFVMKIGLHSISEDSQEFAIDFVDRFGTNFLRVDIIEPIQ